MKNSTNIILQIVIAILLVLAGYFARMYQEKEPISVDASKAELTKERDQLKKTIEFHKKTSDSIDIANSKMRTILLNEIEFIRGVNEQIEKSNEKFNTMRSSAVQPYVDSVRANGGFR